MRSQHFKLQLVVEGGEDSGLVWDQWDLDANEEHEDDERTYPPDAEEVQSMMERYVRFRLEGQVEKPQACPHCGEADISKGSHGFGQCVGP